LPTTFKGMPASQKKNPREWTKCNCPIWVQGTLHGEWIKKSLNLRAVFRIASVFTPLSNALALCTCSLSSTSSVTFRKSNVSIKSRNFCTVDSRRRRGLPPGSSFKRNGCGVCLGARRGGGQLDGGRLRGDLNHLAHLTNSHGEVKDLLGSHRQRDPFLHFRAKSRRRYSNLIRSRAKGWTLRRVPPDQRKPYAQPRWPRL
jgi:hypothetical protein